ncbi:MAG: helix-turn-helix transcriptional regulator [Ruminococcaceae bacterium]|nr:helix-turn-helix transcriptional regulator [Oscillospiraceae bacterium]
MFRIKLKELRESKGLSQYTFARDFGVSQSAVGNWESGIRLPKADIIEKIAEYFDVSVDYLLGRTEEKKPSVQSDEGIDENTVIICGRDGKAIKMHLSDKGIDLIKGMLEALDNESSD